MEGLILFLIKGKSFRSQHNQAIIQRHLYNNFNLSACQVLAGAHKKRKKLNMYEITTKLAGVTFDQCQENINLYGPPAITEYKLKRESDNPHDPNAIQVGLEPFKFGFVPGHIAKEIAPKMDVGTKFMVKSVSVNRSAYHNTVGMTVKITEINN